MVTKSKILNRGLRIVWTMLSAAILLLIVLPLILSLLLDITAVQNFVIDKAAGVASRALGTTVSIDRVDIGLFNKVKVNGFYVEDYQHDTLLYVNHLDAYITSLGLLGGGLSFSRAEIVGAKLAIRETPEGEMNIKQVVARMSNPNNTKSNNFALSLSKATIKDLEFCLERNADTHPEFGIDFAHMHLYNIQARITNFKIDGSNIHSDIASLSARERSGFVLDHLSGLFYLTSGCLGFERTHITTSRSNISIPYISLVGNSWADYKEFIGEVRLDGLIEKSSVSTDDIAYFAPRLRDWHINVTDINADVAGVVSDFTAKINSMQFGPGTNLTANAVIKGLPDIKNTHFNLMIPRISSTGYAVDLLAASIAGKKLPDGLVSILDNAGKVDLGARFEGLLSSFDVQLSLSMAAGNINSNVHLRPIKGGRSSIKGDIQTRSLRIGKLLGREQLFGLVSVSAKLDGQIGGGRNDANVTGLISKLGFNGYVYDSLQMDGRLQNRGFNGRISARDNYLDFDFSGLVDFNGKVPEYDFSLDLRHANLAKLNINRRDSISQLSAKILAKASGSSLDDMNGKIRISDASYSYNDKKVSSREMLLSGQNSPQSKLVEFRSDFADITFRSKTSYKTVFEYLRRSAWRYLPLLHNRDTEDLEQSQGTAVADDYSLLSVDISNFNPIADAISSGLQISDGSSLRLLFNPASDKLSLRASSDYIERERILATRLNINASNQGDSLRLYASSEDLYVGAMHFPRLSVTAGAKQGKVLISTGFTDTVTHVSAMLGMRAEVVRENGPNGRLINVNILPSYITRGDKRWQILARQIQLDSAGVTVDKFFIRNHDQELMINGVASRSLKDSVTVNLQNFELAPFTQVIESVGYSIDGLTNGQATIKSALRSAEISADILLDSLHVNGLKAPPMHVRSSWDFSQNRAGISVTDRKSNKTLVRGFYDPQQVRYYARLTADSLNMKLLDPILSGVISNTKGLASVDVTLQGRGREAELAGQIQVRDLQTTVDFTQVTYSMPTATVEVKGNHFRAINTPVFDPMGNQGRFDLDLNLQHLSNIAYSVSVAPQRMLVLNTTERDNSMFYGRVFATGSAHISGDKGFVKMDVMAASEGNSSFHMPLNSRSDVTSADFVTFVQPIKKDTTDLLALKRQSFERLRTKKASAANQMSISLALDVRPNLDFQMPISGSLIKARGQGSLNLQINPSANVFEMYGDYTISEGSYNFSLEDIFRKNFLIESGSTIQWSGSPMAARLNIDAIYKVKASLIPLLQGSTTTARSVPVDCIIRLRDYLTDPSITFDVKVPAADPETQTIIATALSTPETINTQFLYLLLFNSFLAENSAASTNIGSSVSAATGLEFLTGLLSSWISADDYNIVIRYRPSSELTSEEVDFGLSKSLVNDRLFVEVEGNYIVDNKKAASSAVSNFMGEAYVTYLIDRSGSLKLKAFTQTIDRFDENQGLQETGMGLYYKEDFDNFRDFRQRVKERFSNKARKERRAAKAAQREQDRLKDSLAGVDTIMHQKQKDTNIKLK